MSKNTTFHHTEPFITVFGSAMVRVTPDVASIQFTVSRLEQQPQTAFQQTHQAAQQVRDFLAQANFKEVGSSQVTVSQEFTYQDRQERFAGYRSRVKFHVVLRDLTRMEELLIGVIDAGADSIEAPVLQTSLLKEIRAEARQSAIAAARTKAEIYCEAAGIQLGKVVYIVDENPDQLRIYAGHHAETEKTTTDETIHAFDPGSIMVGGAVTVTFEIVYPESLPKT